MCIGMLYIPIKKTNGIPVMVTNSVLLKDMYQPPISQFIINHLWIF